MAWGSGVSAGGGGGGGEGGGVSPRATGWANYLDTQYTVGSPLAVAANTRILLPNNAGNKVETQLPEDLARFYDPITKKIPGTTGSDILVTVRIKLKAVSPDASSVKLEMDIGPDEAPLVIEATSRALPWGVGVEEPVTFHFSGYCAEEFTANGARLFLTSDGAIEVYGISYVIKRTHKGV